MAKVTITIEDNPASSSKTSVTVKFSPAINPLSEHDTTPAIDLAFALLNRANEIRSQLVPTEPQEQHEHTST